MRGKKAKKDVRIKGDVRKERRQRERENEGGGRKKEMWNQVIEKERKKVEEKSRERKIE